jgi:GNAT superfamily N-acetyltransferase
LIRRLLRGERSKCVAGRRANGKVAEVVIPQHEHRVRQATAADAAVVAELLDAFNREFDTPSPGTEVLTARLRQLIAANHLVALLTGEPAIGVAVLSLRPNVWYEGPVALLDELYVRPDMRGQRFGHAMLEAACRLARERGAQTLEINVDGEDTDARRFYEAHGFTNTEPGATEPMFYYYRDLT